jgi:hypothetical protein
MTEQVSPPPAPTAPARGIGPAKEVAIGTLIVLAAGIAFGFAVRGSKDDGGARPAPAQVSGPRP